MATCLHCTTELTGRTKVCDSCKKRVARQLVRKRSKAAAKKAAASKRSGPAPVKRAAKRGPVPDGLRHRGAALWRSLDQTEGTAPGEIALEACRLADRLNDLESIIAGKGVLNLLAFRLRDSFDIGDDRTINVDVSFQNVLGEARQQALAFKQLLAELGITAVPKTPTAPTPTNALDEIRRRREQKAAK